VVLLVIVLAALAGCGGDDGERPGAREAPGRPANIAPPDAGTRAGHAGDEPRRVRVPRVDRTAPVAVLQLGGAEATSGAPAPDVVQLGDPVLEPTATGRDKEGMGHVRVRLDALVRCGDSVLPVSRSLPGGAPVAIAPGAVAPIQRTRRVRFDLAAARCPDAVVTAADGTLRADVVSAREASASTPPVRFAYRP
jgi:hypothetical protein